MRPTWEVLYTGGADVVVSGNDHNYQRFAPQRGIREFVVGTGGAKLYPVGDPLPATEAQSAVHGVLALALLDGGYEWRFESVPGETFTDRGSARCR
jgi:hypothetical protein